MKIVFYAALFGNYDSPPKVDLSITKKYKFLLYTDQNINTSNNYEVIKIVRPDKSAIISNRIIKFMSHKYCKDYDIAIYHDSNIEIKYEFIKYIENNLKHFGNINFFKHPRSNNINAELSTLYNLGKINLSMYIKAQNYIEKNIQINSYFPCTENNIIITNPKVIEESAFFEELIHLLKTVIPRDQIILPVLLSKYNIDFTLHNSLHVDKNHKFFIHNKHRKKAFSRMLNQLNITINIFMYLFANSNKK